MAAATAATTAATTATTAARQRYVWHQHAD